MYLKKEGGKKSLNGLLVLHLVGHVGLGKKAPENHPQGGSY